MGMSGRTYSNRGNEITKAYYFRLLSIGKRDLVYTMKQQDGQEIYFIRD